MIAAQGPRHARELAELIEACDAKMSPPTALIGLDALDSQTS